MAEIKELRKQAMRRRQLAPASSGPKYSAKARRTHEVGVGEDKGRTPINDDAGVIGTVEVDHPEAWEWYLKAAACG